MFSSNYHVNRLVGILGCNLLGFETSAWDGALSTLQDMPGGARVQGDLNLSRALGAAQSDSRFLAWRLKLHSN
eukprot:1625431-Amphidinium_carterae.1